MYVAKTPSQDLHHPRIAVVDSFEALAAFRFGPVVNAVCWPRQLPGDFDEVAALFAGDDDITSLDEAGIEALKPRLTSNGIAAADALIADLKQMRGRDLQPSLECVPRYERDDAAATVPTDVYSFHADRAPVPADTWLCSYNVAASELIANEDAIRRIDVPETHAALLAEFAESGESDFDDYVRENCYDLHYAAKQGAVPVSFGFGNLWRIAIAYPGCPVAPCVHRAPETTPEQLPRLLLIS